MSQPLLITKYDFAEFWPVSQNVADELVNPYISKAQTFDVRPLLTADEWAGLIRNQAHSAGEFPGLEFSPAEFLATAPATEWDDDRLAALWVGFVKPLLVTESFRQMLLWHGTHITQNGVETFSDTGSQPVSSARRSELKSDVEAARNLYRARLESALRLYRGTATTTCGNATRRRPGRGGVRSHAI